MNLYYISQEENNDWDTYDSAVVAAESEELARHIHPSPSYSETYDAWNDSSTWASCPENVTVELIGTAKEGTQAGVICASFNAG